MAWQLIKALQGCIIRRNKASDGWWGAERDQTGEILIIYSLMEPKTTRVRTFPSQSCDHDEEEQAQHVFTEEML